LGPLPPSSSLAFALGSRVLKMGKRLGFTQVELFREADGE
jgi:hypothetical protein